MSYSEYLENVEVAKNTISAQAQPLFTRWWILCPSPFLGLIVLLYVGAGSTQVIVLAIGISTFLLGWCIMELIEQLALRLGILTVITEAAAWKQLREYEDPQCA